MKSQVINTRVSDTLKDDIDILCSVKDMTISDFGRKAFKYYYDHISIDESKTTIQELDKVEKETNVDLLQSLEYTELIFWVFEKRSNPDIGEIESYYYQQLETINKLKEHPKFSYELKYEFIKIAVELEGYLNGTSPYSDNFMFANSNNPNSFRYDLLITFMYSIERDDKGNIDIVLDS